MADGPDSTGPPVDRERLRRDLGRFRDTAHAARKKATRFSEESQRLKREAEALRQENERLKTSSGEFPALPGTVGPKNETAAEHPSAAVSAPKPSNGTGAQHQANGSEPLSRRFQRPPGTVSEAKFRATQSFARSMALQASEAAGDIAHLQTELDAAKRGRANLRAQSDRRGLLAGILFLVVAILVAYILLQTPDAAVTRFRITDVRYDKHRHQVVGTAVPHADGRPLPRPADIHFVWTRSAAASEPVVTRYAWEGSTLVLYLTVPLDHKVSRDWYVNDVDIGR